MKRKKDTHESLSEATIRSAPKVLLHDHLDGGVRPQTVIDLASEFGYDDLPTTDVDELAAWFLRGANRLDLALYLETFSHTVGVMQDADAIERVAHECAIDLAADGVVYAEVRMAPELCTDKGLTMDEVVEAILRGFESGSANTPLTIRLLCTAMRTAARSVEIAELALRFRDRGVVGFDIAGKEAGFPPSRHLDAFQKTAQNDFHITIHAGEAFGLPSIGPGKPQAWTPCELRPGSPGAPRNVSHVERTHRRRTFNRRTSDPSTGQTSVPSNRQHRQSAHERHLHDP